MDFDELRNLTVKIDEQLIWESATLKEKIKTDSFFGNAPVENASPWTSYRIKHVPRSHGTIKRIGKELQYCLQPVTEAALHDALSAAAGVAPTAITASRDNDKNPTSSSTTWIARFPETHNRLPRTLFLFGCRTQTKILPQRRATVQCTRCWLWHNARTCASEPRCRLCGSSKHSEETHGNLCAATGDHTCPCRCIHCHGPHPADDPKCELRPKPSSPPKSKAQVSAIRRIGSEARMRKQAEAGCVKPTSTLSSTPCGTTTINLRATPSSTRSNNPYEALAVVDQSSVHMETS